MDCRVWTQHEHRPLRHGYVGVEPIGHAAPGTDDYDHTLHGETDRLLPDVDAERDCPEPELSLRTAIIGCAIGSVVCLSNLYFGFKTGLSLGGNITGAILGFGVMNCLPASWTVGFGRKENCTLSSICNAAGGFSGGFITAIPALMWCIPQSDFCGRKPILFSSLI